MWVTMDEKLVISRKYVIAYLNLLPQTLHAGAEQSMKSPSNRITCVRALTQTKNLTNVKQIY
jgi:hypothetical protein